MPAPASPAEAAPVARVALVVGTTAGGTGAHVRMLAAGLAGRGIDVSVLGPSSADAAFGFGALTGATFSPVEFGDRPRPGDVAAALRLRRLLSAAAGSPDRPQVVHAHGLRAGALTAVALAGRRRRTALRRLSRDGGRTPHVRTPGGRRSRLVVTVHNAPPVGGGVRVAVYRLLERVVARGADLVLCVSPDLEARMRSAGAPRVDRAIVPPAEPVRKPASGQATAPSSDQAPPSPDRAPHTTTSAPAATSTPAPTPAPAPAVTEASPTLGATQVPGRPMILAVGRLAAQKDFGTLLAAATHWRDLDPEPQVVIAGDGPLAADLRMQATSLGVDAALLGHRSDVPDLLAAAAAFVLPSRWEGQPLILQEALRAGAAIVATRVGGIPDLVGDDAAVLVPPGDARALAAAIRAVLTDPPLAARLRAAAAARAATLPTEADAVAAAFAAYAHAQLS